MAKRHRRHRRGVRGFGSVITVRPAMRGLGRGRGFGRFRGLGMAGWIAMLLPVLIGIGAPAAVILGLRYWVDPARGRTQSMLVRYAPAVGLGVGATTALVLGMLGGVGAGVATAASAALTAGAVSGYDYVRRTAGSRIDSSLAANAGGGAAPAPGATSGFGRGRGGMGVIVPEFRGLPSRTGAIVMEQQTRGFGKPGQEINLGAVNTQVFGTPGF